MTTTLGRVRAPELRGAGGWINTEKPLELRDVRGRVVVLDFWTFCCINCLRVIEELRPLETRFGDRLVVIGVHSPKFPHEADHAAVARAVRRHRIGHPVLDDPDLETWQQYGVRAWPTLVVIDPDGYVVAMASGEGNGPALEKVVAQLLEGRTDVTVGPAFTPVPLGGGGTLSFPGKVSSDGGFRIAIADTGNDRVLVCDLDGTIRHELRDFHQPQGVRFDADRLLVCDTVSGELIAVALPGGERQVLASGLRSPWDGLVLPDGRIAVAEAGLHRIVAIPANGGEAEVLAGSRAEGLRDGPARDAHLAQPSGLTLLDDGAVAFADSEVSALRVVRDGRVETLVGTGLFDWGRDDGDRASARLQHPLGVAALPGGSIAVADTFNSLLRVWDAGALRTIRLGEPVDEPGGLDVLPDGRLLVADTNHDRVITVDLTTGEVTEIHVHDVDGFVEPAGRALTGRAGAALVLEAEVDLGGLALDIQQGPPVHVSVSVDPEPLLGAGPRSWALDSLPARLDLRLGRPGTGVLTVNVIAATCEADVCTIKRSTREHTLTVS
jgi:thiol-disulfide isomerase/thioredoxin/sugar lactone lactonase YvrE